MQVRILTHLTVLLLLGACAAPGRDAWLDSTGVSGGGPTGPGATGTATSAAASTGMSGATASGSMSGGDTGSISSTEGAASDAGTALGTTAGSDLCDPANSGCPEGFKCQLFEGADSVCVPLPDATIPLDGDCEQDTQNETDDCGGGLVCLEYVSPICMSVCSLAGAGCGPDTTCIVPWADADAGACVPACDPILQNCAAGWGCFGGLEADFGCVGVDNKGGTQAVGCTTSGTCAVGFECIAGKDVAGCGSPDCCTQFCGLKAGPPCPNAMSCVPYFDAPPPGLDNVGLCAAEAP